MSEQTVSDVRPPSIPEIQAARRRLEPHVLTTPTWHWQSDRTQRIFGARTEVHLKLELFQRTGSFKPRGAFVAMEEALSGAGRGVTTVSAGNHALAVAHCARALGIAAKVVMPKGANPVRIEGCRRLGAAVMLADDVAAAFHMAHEIELKEGRLFVHPFEGPRVALGTATLGLELTEQVPGLEAVVIPIGGGGLCAGVASAVKQLEPRCRVYGVEPHGADTMRRSFEAGRPMSIDHVNTIADSLGAPHAAPYSFALCRRFVDELVQVDDDALCRAMALLYTDAKLAPEPAGAAACAALMGPLQRTLQGRRVALIVCGGNQDIESFGRFVTRGLASGEF